MVATHRTLLATEDDADPSLGLYRAYQREMTREFAAELTLRRGRPPTPLEALTCMIGAARAGNMGDRNGIRDYLRRAHYTSDGPHSFCTPGYLGLPEILGVRRTGTESLSGGSTYGFLVRPEYSTVVADRARTAFGPWSFCNIWEVGSREYKLPTTGETGPALSTQFGGLVPAQFGHGELVASALNADGKVSEITFLQDRVVLYTQVSEDIWRDSASLARWLHYAGHVGFRNAVESAMLVGVSGGLGPRGVVTGRATVTVTRASHSAIGATDIDKLYQAISANNQAGVVWHVSKSAMQALRALAASGTYPFLQFPYSWHPGDDGHDYPTLYGKPIFQSAYCPALGTPGDIICADWTDYVLTWIRPRRSSVDGSVIPAGALELAFGDPADMQHRGFVGMPEGSVEMRASAHKLFDTDRLAVMLKARLGGDFLWAGTATEGGGTVGPAAVLST